MSYILEALKKSDQQRQRGTTPTLQAAQLTVLAPQRPMSVYYGLFALVLLATGITAGITIGWLRPWQPQSMPVKAEPVALQQVEPATLPVMPDMPGDTAQKSASRNPAVQAVSVADTEQSYKPARVAAEPVAATPVQDKPVSAAQDDQAIPLSELPPHIQHEIPAMEVQLHAYASVPGERLVSINSIRLREGGSLMLGLRLEQITPDGMIFSYKGYRFRRGVR
jgi:general secretion pathway protein B